MVEKKDLEGVVLLGHLTGAMRDKLRPHMRLLRFDEGETVFKEGESADTLYFLKNGKVLLEKRLSSAVTVAFGSVKPGYSFGWSAMIGQFYTSEALCSEPSEVLALDAQPTMKLMDEDHSLGYIFSQRLLHMIKKRLEFRTEQFVRAIANHPECAVLLE
jgi:CRP-like cAMP-binding protein